MKLAKEQKLTKEDLIQLVVKNIRGKTRRRITREEVSHITNRFLYELNHAFLQKKHVSINNFGVFRVIKMKDQFGRHPVTGATMVIPRHWSVRFKLSKKVRALFD